MGKGRLAVHQLLYPDKFDLDGFALLFSDELESCFTADIACCDACFDKYCKKWPGLAASEEFQCNSIPLDCFYSGSYMRGIYTYEEFQRLCGEMGCPKCGSVIKHFIYPFNRSCPMCAA